MKFETISMKSKAKNSADIKRGDFIRYVQPWIQIPLCLEFAIRTDGGLVFPSWAFTTRGNYYLHTNEKPENLKATPKQCDTISDLWSGRIRFAGLKIAVGATV